MLNQDKQPTLTLYSTLGCHLCDLALGVINNCSLAVGIPLITVDIADDDELVSRYGVRIPVIAFAGEELGWPFDVNDLSIFLSSQDF